MIYNKPMTEFSMDLNEICINLWYFPTAPLSMHVNIPKLMPYIPHGKPSASYRNVPVNDSIFANASDCKITVPSSVKTQNFLTLTPHPNRTVEYGGRTLCKHMNMVPGQKFLCEILQGDIRSIYLSDKL